jgi:prepilin-type N-terminal cleavage/methylation domain-containing protein
MVERSNVYRNDRHRSRGSTRGRGRRFRGFSLIESLVALVLSLAVILSGIELFGAVRHVFFKLENLQSDRENVSAALERIRLDLQRAGRGLPNESAPGTNGIEVSGGGLTLRWLEDSGNGPEIQTVLYSLDAARSTLRRKAGAGTAQPLLEGAGTFSCSFDPTNQIVTVEVRLSPAKEKSHGLKIRPKNLVLAAQRM